jgi:hypothetical protein
MYGFIARALVFGLVPLLSLAGCRGNDAPTPSTPFADAPVIDCTDNNAPSGEQSDELCALLCAVPGGLEECPVGKPCQPAPRSVFTAEGRQAAAASAVCKRGHSGSGHCDAKR